MRSLVRERGALKKELTPKGKRGISRVFSRIHLERREWFQDSLEQDLAGRDVDEDCSYIVKITKGFSTKRTGVMSSRREI